MYLIDKILRRQSLFSPIPLFLPHSSFFFSIFSPSLITINYFRFTLEAQANTPQSQGPISTSTKITDPQADTGAWEDLEELLGVAQTRLQLLLVHKE